MWEVSKVLGGGRDPSSPSQGHGAELLLSAGAPVLSRALHGGHGSLGGGRV